MPPLHGHGTDPEAERPEYAGQYPLEKRLGSGGMGIVHLSRSTSGMRLAVKVVHQAFAADPHFRARFRQEVAAARRVSGAFTASVVDADPEAERPWMATLFIPGPTLHEFVKRNGPVPPAQLRHLMTGLAEALRDIHRSGVVHRDLKPSNVLLAADGPKVIDFGISRPSDSALRTETGKLIGTPPFMAPEQFRRPREVGPAADVFAMGCVLVHAATGRSPFDSDSPYVVAYQVVHDEPDLKDIPADLQPLIERCLAKEPEDRPTPDALMAELRTVSASYNTQAFPSFDIEAFIPAQRQSGGAEHISDAPEAEAETEPERRRPRRIRREVALAVALAVVVAGGVLAVQRFSGPGGAGSAPSGPGRNPGAAKTFRPWSSTLGHGTADDGTMPLCSYAEGALYCVRRGVEAAKLDPRDGEVVWSRQAGRDGTNDVLPLSPILSDGLLRVVTPDRSRLEGLDPSTGSTRWDLDISTYRSGLYNAGATVLLVSSSGVVTGVDGASGEKRWQKTLPGHTWPAFTHYGDSGPAYAVELAGDGASTLVSAVDPDTGEVRWQRRLDGNLRPIGNSGGAVYFYAVASDADAQAVAIVRYDPAGRTVRRIPLVFPLSNVRATVHGDVVYLLGYGGSLLAVNTRSRGSAQDAQLWRAETSVAEGSEPVVVGDRLYFTAGDGRLLAVDTKRGELIGQTKPRPDKDPSRYVEALPSPIAVGGRVFATAPDGTVFAVDARDPSRW
jgi:outer membrane protein assembly factor BamB